VKSYIKKNKARKWRKSKARVRVEQVTRELSAMVNTLNERWLP
jgi:hypothetical protein